MVDRVKVGILQRGDTELDIAEEYVLSGDNIRMEENIDTSVREYTDLAAKNVQFTCYDCGEVTTKRTVDYYDSAGGVNVSGGATVAFDTARSGSDSIAFSVSSGEVTVNIGEEYKLSYDISIEITSGTNRSSCRSVLQINTGAAWVDVDGTDGYMYNRTLVSSENSASGHAILTLNHGDKVRIYCERVAGSSTVATIANGSRLLIEPSSKRESTTSLGIDCGDVGENATLAIYDCGEI